MFLKETLDEIHHHPPVVSVIEEITCRTKIRESSTKYTNTTLQSKVYRHLIAVTNNYSCTVAVSDYNFKLSHGMKVVFVDGSQK